VAACAHPDRYGLRDSRVQSVRKRQRHKAADGEQRHQIVVPGGGQVQDDFEDVEHGLDQVSDVFHVPWYAFAGHVYARSRFW
jgi:hypothetical protein